MSKTWNPPGWSMAAVAGLGAVLATASPACSRDNCQMGVLPFDGATGVDRLAPIVFRGAGGAADQPSYEDTVTLVRVDNGEAIDFLLEVLPDGVVEITPNPALNPDTEYRVTGVDVGAADSRHFVGPRLWDGPFYLDATSATFTTGVAPTLLDVLVLGPDEGDTTKTEVVLVVSEDVPPDDLPTVVFEQLLAEDDTSGTVIPSTWVGPYVSDAERQRYVLDVPYDGSLRVLARAEALNSLDGQVTAAAQSVASASDRVLERLERFGGEVNCGF